jgi:hypothetical protein
MPHPGPQHHAGLRRLAPRTRAASRGIQRPPERTSHDDHPLISDRVSDGPARRLRRTAAHRFYQRLGFEASHAGMKRSL